MNADKTATSRPFDPDKHVLRIADSAVLLLNHGLHGLHGLRGLRGLHGFRGDDTCLKS